MSDFSIERTAKLANLALSDEEMVKLKQDLDDVLAMVEQIQSVNTEGVDAVASVNGLSNYTREDVVGENLDTKEFLERAPLSNAGYVKVPKVLD